MPKISISQAKSPVISDYDGDQDKGTYRESSAFQNGASLWNFFRDGSNHSYVSGKISYVGNCENNLVISSRDINLNNVRNAFVLANNGAINVMPMDMPIEAARTGLETIGSKKVIYHIPRSVAERENLERKSNEELSGEIESNYEIVPIDITLIPSMSKLNGVYHFRTKDGKRFVFKFRDKNRDAAEIRSLIATTTDGFFPETYQKQGSLGYTIQLSDGWYGLERFIEGDVGKRDLDYFDLVGEHTARLHQCLGDFQKKHNGLTRILTHSEGHLREASSASFYIDLASHNEDSRTILSDLERIISSGFNTRMKSLPAFLIHGDLNQSNILWVDGKPVVIDSESMGMASRPNDFVPPLLIKGNRNRPEYLAGSLTRLIQAYNQQATEKLSSDEEEIMTSLLKYSLIRYYIIRNIRRNLGDVGFPSEINNVFKSLGK